ncbi:MAG: hypothetical protein IJV92_08890 [Phascolarctobacterium sp.]|nr:hypothetical protein [Phascolarctobacterium sp.]
MLYEYLKYKYQPNEPIFLSNLSIEGMSYNNLRQQIKKLVDSGLLIRYDTGIYYIPEATIFKSGSQLSFNRVVKEKYLLDDSKNQCGYISGVYFANAVGLTTQVPMKYDIVTNKATKDYREVKLAQSTIIVRKPKIEVTSANHLTLQFLDLIKDIDSLSEIEGTSLNNKLKDYIQKANLQFKEIEKYLDYYPDKIYKNMYKVGILSGISA